VAPLLPRADPGPPEAPRLEVQQLPPVSQGDADPASVTDAHRLPALGAPEEKHLNHCPVAQMPFRSQHAELR